MEGENKPSSNWTTVTEVGMELASVEGQDGTEVTVITPWTNPGPGWDHLLSLQFKKTMPAVIREAFRAREIDATKAL